MSTAVDLGVREISKLVLKEDVAVLLISKNEASVHKTRQKKSTDMNSTYCNLLRYFENDIFVEKFG